MPELYRHHHIGVRRIFLTLASSICIMSMPQQVHVHSAPAARLPSRRPIRKKRKLLYVPHEFSEAWLNNDGKQTIAERIALQEQYELLQRAWEPNNPEFYNSEKGALWRRIVQRRKGPQLANELWQKTIDFAKPLPVFYEVMPDFFLTIPGQTLESTNSRFIKASEGKCYAYLLPDRDGGAGQSGVLEDQGGVSEGGAPENSRESGQMPKKSLEFWQVPGIIRGAARAIRQEAENFAHATNEDRVRAENLNVESSSTACAGCGGPRSANGQEPKPTELKVVQIVCSRENWSLDWRMIDMESIFPGRVLVPTTMRVPVAKLTDPLYFRGISASTIRPLLEKDATLYLRNGFQFGYQFQSAETLVAQNNNNFFQFWRLIQSNYPQSRVYEVVNIKSMSIPDSLEQTEHWIRVDAHLDRFYKNTVILVFPMAVLPFLTTVPEHDPSLVPQIGVTLPSPFEQVGLAIV